MTTLLRHLAMLFLVLPFAVAQTTAVQRVCDAVKDPYSPQCVLVNGMPQTTTAAPKQPPPVVPTWTPPTSTQSQNANVQQSVPAKTAPAPLPAPAQSTTVYQNQSVTVNNGPSAYDQYLARQAAAAQAERDRQNAQAGQALGNALGNAIQNARARHFVKKFCKQNGPGATWWFQFQGQPRITGTCGY
jgi:hypothetical protein